MASLAPHKVFLVTEILEMILLEPDMRTLLTSAQRVCRQWRSLIEHSSKLQAALFFKPVKYRLPRGEPGFRNPLLADYIWPIFCARNAHKWGAPPVEGGAKIPTLNPRDQERFFREGASWKRMLFQQPPRSCIGLVEKDGKAVNGPAYTEIKVRPHGDYLRIGHMIYLCGLGHCVDVRKLCQCRYFHPLPEEGLLWVGKILPGNAFVVIPRGTLPLCMDYWEIPRSQVAYATSAYLRDSDVVFFTLECGRARNQFVVQYDFNDAGVALDHWLRNMRMSLVPGQVSIPMLDC